MVIVSVQAEKYNQPMSLSEDENKNDSGRKLTASRNFSRNTKFLLIINI